MGIAIDGCTTSLETNPECVIPIRGPLDVGDGHVRRLQYGFRELRPLVGRMRLFSDHGDGALEAANAQRFCGTAAGLAGPCDPDVINRPRHPGCAPSLACRS